MGITSSLYSGVSGLNANASAMSVIGNNIANANTIGFKSSRALFGDLLSSQIGGSSGTSQLGRGVGLSTVDNMFSQGTFENTESNSDLAIEGPGFFIVSNPETGNSVNNYTRAGAFRFDPDGNLTNPEGFNVMGYSLDAAGNTFGDLKPIQIDTRSFIPAGPTANLAITNNLNANATTIAGGFDPLDADGTSNYATSIQVYDSLGTSHLMTTYYTKTADQQWSWNTVVDGGELTGGTPGELTLVGSGTLAFDASGNLAEIDGQPLLDAAGEPIVPRPTATTIAGALTWNNGSLQNQQLAIDMQTTQYANQSVVISQQQDGTPPGTLVKLTIDEQGNVIGNFSNGPPRKLMQLALAKFNNPGALEKIGNNMFAQSGNSGIPTIGTVGSGVGNIYTNSLELSNVDLAQEFIKMITTQRGFSANSKTITTTDEMLAEVINLKR
ncbi:MAG: flagellar hook protein FlgE [Pelovirga sp.]|jgi:flagellar hook protein FlgE